MPTYCVSNTIITIGIKNAASIAYSSCFGVLMAVEGVEKTRETVGFIVRNPCEFLRQKFFSEFVIFVSAEFPRNKKPFKFFSPLKIKPRFQNAVSQRIAPQKTKRSNKYRRFFSKQKMIRK